MIRCLLPLLLIPAITAIPAVAADVDYVRQIKPLLKRHCVACHGPLRQKGGLRLDAATLIRMGGDSGATIVAGKPDDSLLVGVLTGKGGYTQMPKDGKPLKPAEMALIRRWVQQGAIAPADEKVAPLPSAHWAYHVPKRPAVPNPKNRQWVKNPIDAFIAVQHERRGLKPQPAEAKHILLRRVYLDLIGLPPTPEELQAFLNDKSPDAYEKVVDRLLKSPRYGERWGRHWMDVWRYSDWYGYRKELRNSAKHIWRWRDYIVESLNKDRPYREMIVDMLAADENTPTDRDRLRATGFLARHYYKFNRDVWLDSAIEHTGKAFLGLTFNCARCHEHKYDPIDHRDYYEFRAIFEPYRVRGDRVPGEPDVNKDSLPRVYDAKPDAKTFVYIRGNDKHPDKEHPCSASLPDFLGEGRFAIHPVHLPVQSFYPSLRNSIVAEMRRNAQSAVNAAKKELQKARPEQAKALARKKLVWKQADLKALDARIAAERTKYKLAPGDFSALAKVASHAERAAEVARWEYSLAQIQQDYAAKKAAVSPKDKKGLSILELVKKTLTQTRQNLKKARAAAAKESSAYKPLGTVYPQTSTGRRLALAKWIADRRNPLTARVAVNHIWMRHFGKPLVSTTFDFGLNGKPPSHPQLLDWLAVEFMKGSRGEGRRSEVGDRRSEVGGRTSSLGGSDSQLSTLHSQPSAWSMKHLHRLIVTSNAYRMSSSTGNADPRNLAVDQDNRYLWRMNSRRMEAEIVRDSVLFVAGQLDLTMGGPDLDAKLGLTTARRSLYYRHAPEKFMPFLQIFDGASTHECYRRNETVVPQQSLAMINSSLLIEQSRRLTALLDRGVKTDGEFVDQLFLRTLSRKPTANEMRTCLDFLASQSKRLKAPGKLSTFVGGSSVKTPPSNDPRVRARENLAEVMLNHNEFITIR
jgi:mono/diheme cytochrome c family protein